MKKILILIFFTCMFLTSALQADNVENFVSRFYTEVLHRSADTAGLNYWSEALRNGNKSGEDIAHGFIFSDEYNINANSNEAYLQTLYKAFFNRAPDNAGLEFWNNALKNGQTKAEILDGFLKSDEFSQLAQSFGIVATQTQNTTQDFVERFYTEVLGRTSDANGLASWTSQLESHTLTGEDVAKGFIQSQEFENKSLDNNTYVQTLYKSFFGREADEGGLQHWLNELNHGASKDEILNGFLHSQEFRNLSDSYGIVATRDQLEHENSNSNDENDHDSDHNEENGEGTTGGNTTTGGGTNTSNGYMLTAWNDLGMHCMDGNDFSVFSVLPPYNNLHAQLKDKNGGLVTSGVTLTYQATTGTDGQTNTSSADKTNFWDFSNKLFPNSNLQANVGLTGNQTPSTTPQLLTFDTTEKWWKAEGLPLTPYNDDGSKNYYPLVKVTAKDSAGNVLATANVVLPVSDELDCKRCHATNSLAPKAKPTTGWVNETDPEKDFKFNVLRLHDERAPNAVTDHASELTSKGYTYDAAGLEATARAGTPILCAACHSSNALPGTGVSGVKAFTNAIHSYHATVVDPYTNLAMNDSTNRDSCYACHPGSSTKCLRGAMGDAKDTNGQNTMQCQSCHGTISHVGDVQRKGWLDEPNCQACHFNGKRESSAIDPATNTLRHVVDTRFATNLNTPAAGISLYRFSTGHGDLQCEACHGATHAIYPAHNADNILSEGIQGHSGTIGECSSCHSSVPNTTTGGPHGMHPVGQTWVKDHQNAAENNNANCKACHGQDYRGSALSKTWIDRTFDVEGKTKTFAKGHQINCYDCHNGPNP